MKSLICRKTKDHSNRDDDDDDNDHGKHKDKDKGKATSQADCKKGTCFACGGAFPGCSCRKAYCDDLEPQESKEGKEGKGKKKDKPELTECTIQGPNSGGGCKTGFKWVCEKMKSGKKCCGCAVDPNAPKTETCCLATIAEGHGSVHCGASEAEARQLAQSTKINGKSPVTVTCPHPK